MSWQHLLGRLAEHEEERGATQGNLGFTDRFELRGELGRGAMGRVLRAWDRELRSEVALKLLPEAEADSQGRERFKREAEALGRLRHPHVTRIHDLLEGPPLVLVLELIEGESLAERLRRGPLPVEVALRIALEVADALDAAHAEGILHRDVKPANVLLDGEMGAHLSDFGLARLIDAETLTRTGQALGSPAYMSPEQATGFVVEARTDVYGLGATLYEALTGELPLTATTLEDMLVAIEERTPVPAHQRRAGIGVELSGLCSRCLAKSADDRPSLAEFQAELERIRVAPTKRSRPLSPAVFVLSSGLLAFGLAAWLASRGLAPQPEPLPPVPRASALDGQQAQVRHPGARLATFFGVRGLASAGATLLRVWDLPAGTQRFMVPLSASPRWVACRADGERVACAFGSQVRVWDAQGKEVGRWVSQAQVGLWVGERLVVGGEGFLRIAEVEGTWIELGAQGPVQALALAHRGESDLIVGIGGAKPACERIGLDGRRGGRWELRDAPTGLLAWDEGAWILSTGAGAVLLAGKRAATLVEKGPRVVALARVGADELLVSRSDGLTLWRVSTGERLAHLDALTQSLEESPDWEHVLLLRGDALEVRPRSKLLSLLESGGPLSEMKGLRE
jgi:hypothetical protein